MDTEKKVDSIVAFVSSYGPVFPRMTFLQILSKKAILE